MLPYHNIKLDEFLTLDLRSEAHSNNCLRGQKSKMQFDLENIGFSFWFWLKHKLRLYIVTPPYVSLDVM